MTDNNAETPQQEATGDKAMVTADSRPAGRSFTILVVVLAVLVLVAVAAGSYSIYLSRQALERQSMVLETQSDLDTAVADIAADQEQLQAAVDQLREAQQTTSAALQEFADRERMDNVDWAMAEIEYLVIIAMQRLNLGHDADTAQAALEAAARRLKDLNDPSLIPVREQLTSDINALRAVPETDVPGMALYLGDLITRAEDLPLAADSVTRPAPSAGQPAAEEISGWRELASAVWNELRQLVVIQREDSPPTELLAPDERYFLYQNLRIELASARAAALRRDTRNLHTSIELIQDWLQRYFNTDAEAVTNIRQALAEMATVELKPELPDISGSLESVRAWQRQHAENGQAGNS